MARTLSSHARPSLSDPPQVLRGTAEAIDNYESAVEEWSRKVLEENSLTHKRIRHECSLKGLGIISASCSGWRLINAAISTGLLERSILLGMPKIKMPE